MIEYTGSVRFAKNICAEKSAEPFQFADNNLPTHNLPKETTFFDIFILSAVKLKMLNHNLPSRDLPNEPRRVRVRLGNRFKGPPQG